MRLLLYDVCCVSSLFSLPSRFLHLSLHPLAIARKNGHQKLFTLDSLQGSFLLSFAIYRRKPNLLTTKDVDESKKTCIEHQVKRPSLSFWKEKRNNISPHAHSSPRHFAITHCSFPELRKATFPLWEILGREWNDNLHRSSTSHLPKVFNKILHSLFSLSFRLPPQTKRGGPQWGQFLPTYIHSSYPSLSVLLNLGISHSLAVPVVFSHLVLIELDACILFRWS